MSKACAIAGHRPTRFKFKYKEDYSLCKKIKKKITEQLKYLYDEKGVLRIYVGRSLGVDIWVGEIVLRLKETSGYEKFELAVILPFPGHDQKWDLHDDSIQPVRYAEVKRKEIILIHPDTAEVTIV